MDQGDFFVHFMDLTEEELKKPVDDITPTRLEALLELALRMSTANTDPFKDDLKVGAAHPSRGGRQARPTWSPPGVPGEPHLAVGCAPLSVWLHAAHGVVRDFRIPALRGHGPVLSLSVSGVVPSSPGLIRGAGKCQGGGARSFRACWVRGGGQGVSFRARSAHTPHPCPFGSLVSPDWQLGLAPTSLLAPEGLTATSLLSHLVLVCIFFPPASSYYEFGKFVDLSKSHFEVSLIFFLFFF